MVGDHHVPIDGDHCNAKQRDSNVAVLDERDEAAEHLSMSPGALDEAQSLEGQYEGTEQQIGYAKAVKISKDRISRSRRERKIERAKRTLT